MNIKAGDHVTIAGVVTSRIKNPKGEVDFVRIRTRSGDYYTISVEDIKTLRPMEGKITDEET